VHVLARIHGWLRPRGRVLDIHPEPEAASVDVRTPRIRISRMSTRKVATVLNMVAPFEQLPRSYEPPPPANSKTRWSIGRTHKFFRPIRCLAETARRAPLSRVAQQSDELTFGEVEAK
jgi:hypothetical protein